MRIKAPVVNPETREKPQEPRQELDPSMNVAPDKKPQQLVKKVVRPDWCKFKSKGRCYVEGALLEDSEQEITLSPAASYRQRNNRNLELVSGVIPELPEDAPIRNPKGLIGKERKDFLDYELSFIESLEDGDPRIGVAPGGLKLIRQG